MAPQSRPQGARRGADAEARAASSAEDARYGNDVVAALALCWAVLGAPTGKRLAPIMAELVPRLRRFEELVITDEVACGLIAMSPATMDCRLKVSIGWFTVPMSELAPDETTSVVQAANTARAHWNRIAGNADGSSWLDQMAAGELPPDWPPSHAAAVAELLDALGERARHTRAAAGLVNSATFHPNLGSRMVDATHSRLPMNRKERYFTGTVLPMLIGDNGFAHLHRFLALCGLSEVSVQDGDYPPLDGQQDMQFFTEYGFEESVYTDDDRTRLADRPRERDTPDVVLCGADWLVAVEAKMYHRPSREALEQQFAKQHVLVEYWATRFRLDRTQVAHVLLLPGELEKDRQPLSPRVITWEQVAAAYATVGTAYWVGVLRSALDRYWELCSPEPTFRVNADALMSGADIVAEHGQGTLPYTWMGRLGGKHGKTIASDIATGAWRDQQYEVRREPLEGNQHWFAVSHFVSITAIS